jgi:hypothetical protein
LLTQWIPPEGAVGVMTDMSAFIPQNMLLADTVDTAEGAVGAVSRWCHLSAQAEEPVESNLGGNTTNPPFLHPLPESAGNMRL